MEINLYSDFNVDILKRILETKKNNKITRIYSSQYSQFYQSIISAEKNNNSISIVWTLPENIIESFLNSINGEPIDLKQCLSEVDFYAEKLINLASKSKFLLLTSWIYDPTYSNSIIQDWAPNDGIKFLLSSMSCHLAKRIKPFNNIIF